MKTNETTKDEEFDDEQDDDFAEETEEFFEGLWKDLKEGAKELSKKELAKQMFVSGALMCRESFERHMEELSEKMEKNPDKVKELLKELQFNKHGIESTENPLWEEGCFAETINPADIEEKKRTIHMKHDEEMNYNCKNCDKIISAHNKDWHAGMCDECFNKTHHGNQ